MVDKIKSHETSLHSLATGELDCPRLFVLIPLEKSGSQLSMLLKPKVPPPAVIKPVRTRDAPIGRAFTRWLHHFLAIIRHLMARIGPSPCWQSFVKDSYRLIFLDAVTGLASRCGVDGQGYRIELPSQWLMDNRK